MPPAFPQSGAFEETASVARQQRLPRLVAPRNPPLRMEHNENQAP